MTKLRNIDYLWFGSKIRQGFTSGITSLTPPLSLSPLWISWAENEGASKGAEFYIWGGNLPPPCRPTTWRQGACRPAGGRQAPAKDLCAKKIIFIYI